MLDMIDIANTIGSVSTELPAVAPEPQNEQKLGDEIANMWSAHVNAKNAARATKDELRDIRAKLGEQLSRMKQVLAKPGRGGQWSSFLKERGIPRATADRLVGHYEQSINPDDNGVSEATSEPTEKEIETLFKSILPRLRRFLKTPSSLYRFASLLAAHYECSEMTDRGILVLTPAALTICPVSSDGESIVEPEVGAAVVARGDEEANSPW